MSADLQARYDVLVAETQRLARELAEVAYDLAAARVEAAKMRRELGLRKETRGE